MPDTPHTTSHRPERTCVGCRRKAPRGALLRVVVAGGDGGAVGVRVDPDATLPGRGAWVCPTRRCAEAAARTGLARSFRRAIDPAGLLAWARTAAGGAPRAIPAPAVDGPSHGDAKSVETPAT